MIGLLFFGVIGLWIWAALWLGFKIPVWLKWKRQGLASAVLVPLIFFVPVIDELIAYPQMQALCAAGGYELVMDEKSAQGRTIYDDSRLEPIDLWPTVRAQRMRIEYVDATTREPVIRGYGYIRPSHGLFGIPDGSGDGKMTLLLRTCAIKNIEPVDAHQIPIRFKPLKLNVIQRP